MQSSKRCRMAYNRCNEMEANGYIQDIFRQHVVINIGANNYRELKGSVYISGLESEMNGAFFH